MIRRIQAMHYCCSWTVPVPRGTGRVETILHRSLDQCCIIVIHVRTTTSVQRYVWLWSDRLDGKNRGKRQDRWNVWLLLHWRIYVDQIRFVRSSQSFCQDSTVFLRTCSRLLRAAKLLSNPGPKLSTYSRVLGTQQAMTVYSAKNALTTTLLWPVEHI